ncbi:hypothetical protein CC79DRAFT_1313228 [Sarocladium strictum]
MGEKRQRSESVDELTSSDHFPRPLAQRPRNSVRRRLRHEHYTVAWICPLYFEMASAIAMLEEEHEELPTTDSNHYILGRISHHNIVIAGLNQGHHGIPRATRVLTDLRSAFPSVTRCLLVGIGGGFPRLPYQDIRLGDVIVGEQIKCYDEGKAMQGGQFQRTGGSMRPPDEMATALLRLRARHEQAATATNIVSLVQTKMSGSSGYQHPETEDHIFLHDYGHIHYGAIASGSVVIKDGMLRERMYEELDVMCAETEAAGLMNIVPTLVIRGVSDYCDSHKNDIFQKHASANAAAFALEYLECLKPVRAHQPTESESDKSDRKVKKSREKRLSSIRFDHMSSRQFGITGRLASTCQWLLKHGFYLAWRDDSQLANHLGFLWLKGKPGAGKSTLMRFAYEEHKRPESRRQRAPKTVVAGFFFHARGEELQRSITGMYRSLVYQLFKGFPHLGELLDDPELLPLNKKECPSLDQLRELFQRGIRGLGKRQFICYVDALDECDEKDIAHMARTFQDLAEEHNQQDCRFRVFFSSRHYPHIPSRIGLQLELDNQLGHTNDLKQYTERRLLYKNEAIKKDLVEKSRGVFMWIVLVIDILNEDNVGGLPLSAASKKLRDLPDDLSALFREILRRHGNYMDEFIIAVVWILFATRPLTPKELEHAIWSDQADDEAADMLCSDTSIAEEADRLRQRVTRACKGLAEVITHEDSSAVQFIHESVRDFLLKDQGLVQVWPEVGPHIIHYGHEKLKRCCSNYINSAKIKKTFSRIGVYFMDLSSILKNYSFLEYAVTNVFHHAEQAEPVVPQAQFLRTFAMEPLTQHLATLDNTQWSFFRRENDMLYLLAEGGHARLINVWGQDLPMSCSICGEYGSPLIVALAGKKTEAISALLRLPTAMCTKAQLLNGPGDRSKLRPCWDHSLLSWAAEGAHTELIQVLLGRGAKINELDPGGYTALARAALSNGHSSVAALLEAKKSDVCDEGSFYRSPFWSSVAQDQLQALQLLVQEGFTANLHLDFGVAPLALAARRGFIKVAEWLIAAGASIDGRDEKGHTPLMIASKETKPAMAKMLLQHGADCQAKTPDGWSSLMFACRHSASGPKEAAFETVRHLILEGADVNARGNSGDTALRLAVEWGEQRLVRLLLSAGADITAKDDQGRTILECSCPRPSPRCKANVLALEEHLEVLAKSRE